MRTYRSFRIFTQLMEAKGQEHVLFVALFPFWHRLIWLNRRGVQARVLRALFDL
jgi:hypothetical protein